MLKKIGGWAGWLIFCGLMVACSDSAASPTPNVTTVASTPTVTPVFTLPPATPISVAATRTLPANVAGSPAATTSLPAVAYSPISGAVTIPADLKLEGGLANFSRVAEATGKANSFKFAVTSGGQTITGTFAKPDKVAGEGFFFGQKAQFVLIANDFYFKVEGKQWQKTASSPEIRQVFDSLNLAFIGQLAGGSVAALPDEQLNGQTVGVYVVDTKGAATTLPRTLQNARLTLKYDKTTFQLAQVQIVSPTGPVEVRFSNYDNAANQVTAPI